MGCCLECGTNQFAKTVIASGKNIIIKTTGHRDAKPVETSRFTSQVTKS